MGRQQYLKSSKLSNSEYEILFALRSHTLRGFKANSASSHINSMFCPLLCKDSSQDDQDHLLVCQSILAQLQDTEAKAAQGIQYKDIYGSLESQKSGVQIFARLLSVRLLQPDTETTPTCDNRLPTSIGNSVRFNWPHVTGENQQFIYTVGP